jgi:Big-like domain-containing protein
MFRGLRHTPSARKLAVLFALVAAGGCSLATDVTTPVAVIYFAGDNQTAPTNTALPTSLAVIVTNQFGERLSAVTVTWTVAPNVGIFSATTTQTDDAGLATVDYTTGATAGQVVIQARVGGIPPLSFHITVEP